MLTRLHYAYRVCMFRSDDVKVTNKDYGKVIKKIVDVFPLEPPADLEKVKIQPLNPLMR